MAKAALPRTPQRGSVVARSKRASKTKLKRSCLRDVVVRGSTIKGAGKGLFASRDFAKGTLLPAPYRGKRLSFEAFKRLRDFRWCFTVAEPGCWAVDGKALKRGNPCRWVNGARTAAQRRRVNVVGLKLEDGKPWFATTKAVQAGEEFIIDYGPGYWQAYDLCWGRPERLRLKIREIRAQLQRAPRGDGAALREQLEDLQDELDGLA